MRQKVSRPEPTVRDFAEQICQNEAWLGRYDAATSLWLEQDQPGLGSLADPRVRRKIDGNEYVYTLPVMAAFSIARHSIAVVLKDQWREDASPDAWYVGEYNLSTGELNEPRVLRASLEQSSRQLWLQLVNERQLGNWPSGRHPALHEIPYNQRRIEGRLDENYRLQAANYRFGLYSGARFDDLAALDSMVAALRVRDQVLITDDEDRPRIASMSELAA